MGIWQVGVLLRMESAEVPDADNRCAYHGVGGVQRRIGTILQRQATGRDWFTIVFMTFWSAVSQMTKTRPWTMELAAAVVALLIGAALMPVLIFYSGVAALGRYEGASLGRVYSSMFAGLSQASIASWVVLLGPYGLYVLFKALRGWWRFSAKLN
jgi:hypothetical protein